MNKAVKLFSLLFVLSIIGIGSIEAKENVKIKVLCYNLRFGELASLEELADFIREESPDIIALQEVDVNTFRDRAPHQNGKNFISELAFRTGMLSLYGKTINYAKGYYGIGILSKYPFISSERILLPMPDGAKEQRAVLISEVELPNGRSMRFACTHLDYTTSVVRQVQVEFINQHLLKGDKPTIFCGDFNAKPDSKEISEGMKDWFQASNIDFTVPAKKPTAKIDYIFCYPKDKWRIINAETPKVQLSDHLPVTATLELQMN